MATWKLISWNVNGIRAVAKKGFMDWFNAQDADLIFLQETKAHLDQMPPKQPIYRATWATSVAASAKAIVAPHFY